MIITSVGFASFIYATYTLKKVVGTRTLTIDDLMNPKVALENGVKGYVRISLKNPQSKDVEIKRGNTTNIELYIQFVSHTPELKETKIRLDPEGKGLTIEKKLGDDKGSVRLNDYVKYTPEGEITIRANETITVTMSLIIDTEFPNNIKMPLGPVGISADDVPIINSIGAKLDG